MALEDYTTYTEVDDDGCIAVAAALITVTNMPRDHENYVYRDAGVGHFGDFEHLLKTKVTAGNHALALGGIWAITNVVDDISGWGVVPKLFWYWDPYGAGPQMRIAAGGAGDDSVPLLANTDYWLTVSRVGTAITVEIHSDAARTVLVDTMTPGADGATYRYIYAVANWDYDHPERLISYTVGNLDLQEASLPALRSATRHRYPTIGLW